MKKIIFWGTPPFTTNFLDKLKESNLTPSLIITSPDRPSGRGLKLKSPEPKNWAIQNNVLYLQPEKIDEHLIAKLSKESWDLSIVVAYGKILPQKVIDLPQYGTVNVHYSLLPKYRGASPIESAILNGEKQSGVTVQQMKYALDAGDILSQELVSIDPRESAESLRNKLNQIAVPLLINTSQKIFNNETVPIAQEETAATFCHKIKKEDGKINLLDEATINDRKFRAYKGRPGLFFFAKKNGKDIRVKITKAHLEKESFIIEEVIPENQKKMSYTQYLKWLT